MDSRVGTILPVYLPLIVFVNYSW